MLRIVTKACAGSCGVLFYRSGRGTLFHGSKLQNKMSTKVNGFKYSSNDAQSVVHMVNSIHHGAVSDFTHVKTLDQYSPVVVVTSVDNVSYAIVGFATGKILDVDSTSIWADWDHDRVIHGVDFINRVFTLPSGKFEMGRQSLPLKSVIEIADWALAQLN